MKSNPYDDENFRDRLAAQAIAQKTAVRRLTGMVTGMLAGGNADRWRQLLFEFERDCIADIGTMSWPNGDPRKVAEIKAYSAEEISEMLSVLQSTGKTPE